MADKMSDIVTYAVSLALAAGVIAFAADKVITLNGMDNPPANMGLNFPPPKRKVIMEDQNGVDPLSTQSVSPLGSSNRRGSTPPGDDLEGFRLSSFELLTVIDGVAFVTVGTSGGKTLLPVVVGSTLPGGLKVKAITRREGRWAVLAGNLRIDQKEPALQ